eukprot:31333-Pelagococcus_subviridis.AAC.14
MNHVRNVYAVLWHPKYFATPARGSHSAYWNASCRNDSVATLRSRYTGKCFATALRSCSDSFRLIDGRCIASSSVVASRLLSSRPLHCVPRDHSATRRSLDRARARADRVCDQSMTRHAIASTSSSTTPTFSSSWFQKCLR